MQEIYRNIFRFFAKIKFSTPFAVFCAADYPTQLSAVPEVPTENFYKERQINPGLEYICTAKCFDFQAYKNATVADA